MPLLFDNFLNNKYGIVNVRMVITEEKILSNIDKIQKMINPNSKKQIVELQEDTYFKDLVSSVRTYLAEYPKKKNFPATVYKAAYDLVEYATNQFEENTKKIEELIVQREKNIGLAFELKIILSKILRSEPDAEQEIEAAAEKFNSDLIEAMRLISTGNPEERASAKKLVEARITNLESNFHIEIDMERIEDRSKALSFIGVQIAEALRDIPAPTPDKFASTANAEGLQTVSQAQPQRQVPQFTAPVQTVMQQPSFAQPAYHQSSMQTYAQSMQSKQNHQTKSMYQQPMQQMKSDDDLLSDAYMQQTRFNVKPSLWQRIKNSKFVRTLRYIMKIRVVLELPALPEGRGENNF